MPNTATPPDHTTAGRITPGTAIRWNFDDDKGAVPVTFVRRVYENESGAEVGKFDQARTHKVRLVLQRSAGEEPIVTEPIGKATRIQLDPGAWNDAPADTLTVGPADELGPVVTNAAGERVGVPAPEVRAELARAMESMRPTAATVGQTPEQLKAAADRVVAIARGTVAPPPSPAVEAALAKAREKHRPDEPIQPVTVEPLIERVRAERAAARPVTQHDLTLTRSYPLEGRALVQWELVARFNRPVVELTVTCTNEEIPDAYLVRPEFPHGVGLDDYRQQLQEADRIVDENHPEWRLVGPWQLAGITAETAIFSRTAERV